MAFKREVSAAYKLAEALPGICIVSGEKHALDISVLVPQILPT
jgi:hypothetical protein